MKWYPQKVVAMLTVLILVQILQIVMLSIVCDYTSILRSPNANILMQDNVHITRLVCDTIHAEDIEIFPLMDLDGNVIE